MSKVWNCLLAEHPRVHAWLYINVYIFHIHFLNMWTNKISSFLVTFFCHVPYKLTPGEITDGSYITLKGFLFLKVIKLFHLNRVIGYRSRLKRPDWQPAACLACFMLTLCWMKPCISCCRRGRGSSICPPRSLRGLRSPPPRLRLACHSPHFWSRTNQAGEETCPTAIHAWLVLPMYASDEQKHSRIGFYFQNLSGVLMGSRSVAPLETRWVHLSSV